MFGRKSKSGSIRVSDVKLDEYITTVLTGIANGVKSADQQMRDAGSGSIYVGNISTHSDECVKVGLLKSDTQDNKSGPVLAIQFEVSVAVQDAKSTSLTASLGAGANQLSLVTFDGSIDTGRTHGSATVASQRLRFTIPLSMGSVAQQAVVADRHPAARAAGS